MTSEVVIPPDAQPIGQPSDLCDAIESRQSLPLPDPDTFLRIAVEQLARGDATAALAAASEACYRAPQEPRAHYAYGQAFLALDAPARAEQAFAAALQLAPEWAEAWINYGVARYRQGFVEDAKMAMREALARAPGHPAATANLGAFMRISGESASAETLLRATLARDPRNAAARLNLVADLLQDERAAQALALLDEAAPPADDLRTARHWHLQRALALLQLRRAGEARHALDAFTALGPVPPDLLPLWRWRLVLLAIAENDPQRAYAEAGLIEAALEQSAIQMLPEHRIMMHFDLAKFFSTCSDHPRAFRHWSAGHALLKPGQPFSRPAHAAFIDANIAAFGRSRLANGPRATNRDPAPVFIVGMPRSGTTLCEQILAAHHDVHGAGERMALPLAFADLGGRDESAAAVHRIASLDTARLDRAAARYLAELHALAPDKARIVDKLPGNYCHIGLIATMLPAARIIYCARDPRDIGLSIFTFRFHGYHPYAHDLGDLGWTIAQQRRLMDHWRAVLPDMILTVQLSDWVEDFDRTLARVLAHLGLPHDPACERFYERDSHIRTVSFAQVRQPVNARGIGRWRNYAAELSPLIQELEAGGCLNVSNDPPTASHTTSATS